MWTVLPPTGLACLCLLIREDFMLLLGFIASLKLNFLTVYVASFCTVVHRSTTRVKPTVTFGQLGQPGTLVNILINTL